MVLVVVFKAKDFVHIGYHLVRNLTKSKLQDITCMLP